MTVDRSKLKCPWCDKSLPDNKRDVKIVTRCKGCSKQMKLVGNQYQRCVRGKVVADALESIRMLDAIDLDSPGVAASLLLDEVETLGHQSIPGETPLPITVHEHNPVIHGEPATPEPQGVIEEAIEIDPWDFKRRK